MKKLLTLENEIGDIAEIYRNYAPHRGIFYNYQVIDKQQVFIHRSSMPFWHYTSAKTAAQYVLNDRIKRSLADAQE